MNLVAYICFSTVPCKVLLNCPQHNVVKYDALDASGSAGLGSFAPIEHPSPYTINKASDNKTFTWLPG